MQQYMMLESQQLHTVHSANVRAEREKDINACIIVWIDNLNYVGFFLRSTSHRSLHGENKYKYYAQQNDEPKQCEEKWMGNEKKYKQTSYSRKMKSTNKLCCATAATTATTATALV